MNELIKILFGIKDNMNYAIRFTLFQSNVFYIDS